MAKYLLFFLIFQKFFKLFYKLSGGTVRLPCLYIRKSEYKFLLLIVHQRLHLYGHKRVLELNEGQIYISISPREYYIGRSHYGFYLPCVPSVLPELNLFRAVLFQPLLYMPPEHIMVVPELPSAHMSFGVTFHFSIFL